MASTYTTSLNLELQASGENSGTWGTKTNTNISLLETAICGGSSSSLAITATTQSLTASDGSADQSRRAVLKLTGTLTGNTTLSSEAVEKIYWIDNQATMSTYTLTFKPAGGTGVSLASGRKHLIFQDGSTAFDPLADYGPINSSALVSGGSMTIGSGTDGTDYTLTFDGHAGDGVITWMEDEDYFKFSDDVLMNSTERLNFGDTGTYIFQSADGVLDLVSDSEVEINGTTIDINGATDISGTLTLGTVAAAGTDTDKFLVVDTSGNVDYRTGANVLSDIGGTALTGSTDNTVVTVTGAAAIAGEANFTYDGADGALASSTSNKPVFTLKNTNTDANGSILKFVKDAGEAGAASDLSGLISFYADDADQNNQEFGRIAGRVVDATSGGEEGALDFYVAEYDGTVTKGMEIKGLASDGNITVDISTHDGAAGGLMLASTLVTSTATELNLLDGVSGLVQGDFTKLAAVDSTYGELNLLDGSAKSTSSITIGDTDAFIVIDGTTTKQIPASDISTYVGGVSLSSANVWTGKQSVDLGAANLTPAADGSHLHIEGGVTMTDNNTSSSGTAAKYAQASIEAVTLAATNASVTTTAASTFYISAAPAAGTNQTLTNAYALWVDAGKVQFDADLSVGTDLTVGDDLLLSSSGAVLNFNSGDVTLTHGSNLLTLDGGALDLDGEELILDPGATTSITADTNNQIDIKINSADDFQFTANTFTILSGSTVAIAAGGAITNAGTMAPDISSTGKAAVMGF